MNKEQILNLAKRKIDARRFYAEEQCDKTLRRLRENDEWQICERNLKQAHVDYAMEDGERKKQAKASIDKYSARQKQLMKTLDVKESDLKPKYSCKLCNDTGYVDNKICVCLRNEMRAIIAERSDIRNKNYTFDNSTETDKHNVAVYKAARKAVTNGQNILLTGNTGSGKTYLLSACANLAIEQTKSVLFVTAYSLNSMFLESHLGDIATKQAIMDSIVDVDVLAIDDLGTESVQKNVTAEYLFSVLNERVNRGKQTFISTNLTLADIRDRYDERIFSRLVDQKLTFVAEVKENDKRLKNK